MSLHWGICIIVAAAHPVWDMGCMKRRGMGHGDMKHGRMRHGGMTRHWRQHPRVLVYEYEWVEHWLDLQPRYPDKASWLVWWIGCCGQDASFRSMHPEIWAHNGGSRVTLTSDLWAPRDRGSPVMSPCSHFIVFQIDGCFPSLSLTPHRHLQIDLTYVFTQDPLPIAPSMSFQCLWSATFPQRAKHISRGKDRKDGWNGSAKD